MVTKKVCDVCGGLIRQPDRIDPENPPDVEGSFWYGGIVMESQYDLCEECGAKVRDFIRSLKKREA